MKVGEQVWAYNPRTKKMELQLVQHVWINHDNDLVDLTLTITTAARHGKAAAKTSEVIHTNKKHPFLTKEKGFLPVGQITIGMHVLRAGGTYGTVSSWKLVPGIRVMYNLEVVQDHTFTVGIGQWVVHNCGSGPRFSDDPSKVGHIFRNAPGHLSDDTPANRQLFIDTASNPDNYVGTDRYGKEWYAEVQTDGTQTWVWVRNGVITDAGVNDVPRTNWNPNQGLIP